MALFDARCGRPSIATVTAGVVVLVTCFPVSVALAAALAIDSTDLTAATRTYGAPVTCTIAAVADSYVDQSLATTNFGTGTTLQVSPTLASVRRAFVRFDLAGCSPAIPPDAIVQSATLRLSVAVLTTASRTIDVRSVSSAWTEAGVTWNNQPSVASSVTASTTVPVGTGAGTLVTWTTSSDVQAFVSGAANDLGWRLGDSAEGVLTVATVSLNAREAASGQPQLVVTYVP